MSREPHRRTPEELLREVQAEEAAATRKGHLKIFLGYASGVGKTLRMLHEARRRRERGQDVVIGAVQPQAPPEAQELLDHLEVIPLKVVGRRTAIDVDALIRRRPAICIIDGLAYDNPPGVRNAARWQDVQDLVNAGLKVIGSINIQYIEELRDEVEAITGKHVTQTVPISFIKSADEIEIVDAPAEEPLDRSNRTGVGRSTNAGRDCQSCGRWRWCLLPMSSTISFPSIWSGRASTSISALTNEFWCV